MIRKVGEYKEIEVEVVDEPADEGCTVKVALPTGEKRLIRDTCRDALLAAKRHIDAYFLSLKEKWTGGRSKRL